jgi:hypothetical protein
MLNYIKGGLMKVKIIDIVLRNGYNTRIALDENEEGYKTDIKELFVPDSVVLLRTINRQLYITTNDICTIDCNIVDLENPEEINQLKNQPTKKELDEIKKKNSNKQKGDIEDIELIVVDNKKDKSGGNND